MALRTCRGIVLLASVCLFGGAVAHGNVIYDESVSGDLSNSGLAPTPWTVSLESNRYSEQPVNPRLELLIETTLHLQCPTAYFCRL